MVQDSGQIGGAAGEGTDLLCGELGTGTPFYQSVGVGGQLL